MGGNTWSGMRCFPLEAFFFTRTPTRDRKASGLHASTSTMLRHSAGLHAVGLCGARHRDVRLLCPHGGDLPRCVRLVPERALDSVTRYVNVCPPGLRATALSSCIPCGPHTHTPTESALHLRLRSCHLVMIATPSVSGHPCAACAVSPERM